jgi:putative copper export protein
MYAEVLVLWLNFLGVALFIGGVVFRWAILHPGLDLLESIPEEMKKAESVSQRDLKRSMGGCLILLGIVSIPDLILRAQMMSGKPFSDLPAILPLVLLKTHIGTIWLTKIAILCFLAVLWFFMKARQRSGELLLLVFASAGLALVTTLSGHAVNQGVFSLAVMADWLHMMAISAWVGGLVPLRFLLPRIAAPMEKKIRYQLEAAVIRRFSSFAVGCVTLLTLTGVYSAWLHLRSFSMLVTTAYGVTLLFKLVWVAPMLLLGALSRYYVRPALQTTVGEPRPESWMNRAFNRAVSLLGGEAGGDEYRILQRGYGSPRIAMLHFQIFVALQCLLAVGVLGVTSLLTQTSPPDLTGFTAPGDSSEMHDMEM